MTEKTFCFCGKRMSRYATKCNDCYKLDQERWECDRKAANSILAKNIVTTKTAFGQYVVSFFLPSLDAICYPVGKIGDRWAQRTFALCGEHVRAVISGRTEI